MSGSPFDHPLRLVPTPIGNLGDITVRALDELRAATIICCEDTRRTASLLTHLGVARPRLLVVDEHRERDAADAVIAAMAGGERVVLVSDAGTPGLSDPGWFLVRAVLEAGGRVEALPGATAAVTALVVSGLPADRFAFEGFLPRSGAARTRRLAEVASTRSTVVLYEAPHRLARTLVDLEAQCGPGRPVVLARELTKLHEEVWRGTLGEARTWLEAKPPRGEFVVVLGAAPAGEITDADIVAALGAELASGSTRRDATVTVSQMLGVRRGHVYDLCLQME